MKTINTLSLGLFALLVSQAPLRGQNGQPALADFATEPSADAVNTEAWDSLTSWDSERIFGRWSDQEVTLNFEYRSEYSLWGKKIAGQSFVPSIDLVGPLFGGESYTSVLAILPEDDFYAQQLWFSGGWKYHLLSSLDIDIGGDFVFANENLVGAGVPAPFGWKQRGTFYVGLIGRIPFHPSVYGVYDFDLGQSILRLGLYEQWELGDNFFVEGLARVGWLQANSSLAGDRAPDGTQFRNSYLYGELELNLIYDYSERIDGLKFQVGVGYAGNNDGSGLVLGTVSLDPDQQLWFQSKVSYGF